MKQTALVFVVLAAAGIAAACTGSIGGGDGSSSSPATSAPTDVSNDPTDSKVDDLPDPFEELPKGTTQTQTVCARGNDDAVTKAFCGKSDVGIASLVELRDALGLKFQDVSKDGQNSAGGNPGFALLANSSSLVARSVSATNPRAFIFTPPPGEAARLPGYVIMSYARGETFVEIAAEDANTSKLTFYLVKFDIACSLSDSCKPGDILTLAVEKNWKGVTLYDDEDLKNTIVDCRHCHQPDASRPPMLRMQELKDPWTHWLTNNRSGGTVLIDDFRRVHGEEDYASIPGTIDFRSDGRAIGDFVAGQGFEPQPNEFDSPTIENEVKESAGGQPDVNIPIGKSSTWQALYDKAFTGEFIPPPYHDIKVTDPTKLAYATTAYQKYLSGKMAAADLPDIRRVFLDEALEGMTIVPKKGANGREVLIQTCAQCHNGKLDQSLSRAKFDVTNLEGMTPKEKQLAIARLRLPASDRKHMPPAMFRSIPDDQLQLAIAELTK